MFEDSLVESTGRIHTRSRRYAAGSLVLETALVAVVVLIPYLYPDALPRKFLSVPLIAPPPPAAPVAEPQHAVAPLHTELLATTLLAPGQIPHHIPDVVDNAPPGLNISGAADIGSSSHGVVGTLPLGLSTPLPVARVHPAKPAGPVRVSAGVAAGQLIVPIQPEYPAIARQIHLQGTVIVSAIISTDGRIESLRVLSGPALLVNSAVQAIRQARYRPWQLNGEPVEVETTINVVFSFGSN
jgi:protein TonB